MSTLSIIVPVYQSAAYLSKCVESILAQTFRDLELILADDGSTDGSGPLCDRWAEQDPRVRVLHLPHGGVSAARNAGLDAALGEYVAFADSDDWLDPEMYETMLAVAQNDTCDVVLCDCRKAGPGGESLYTHPIRPGFYDRAALKREYFPHLLMMENAEYPATISNCLLLFRRERLGDLRYLSGLRQGEDLLFGAQLLYRADSLYYQKGFAPYHYRITPDSASRRFDPQLWQDHKRLLARLQREFGAEAYDFSPQLDLCRLFYLFHALTALRHGPLSRRERGVQLGRVLGDPEVRAMLRRLDLFRLPIPWKQKITAALCRRMPRLLILYYGGIPCTAQNL